MELKQKDINLLVPLQKKPGIPPEKKKKMELIALPVLLALLFVAIAGNFFLRDLSQKNQAADIESYMKERAGTYQQAREVESALQETQAMLTIVRTAGKNISTYPLLQRKVLDVVYSNLPGGISITSLSFAQTGTLMVTCTSTGVEQIPVYVDRLKESDQFATVTYYGFKGSQQDGYTFSVTAVPKAGEA